MNKAYLFRIGPLNFIFNVQESTIGYSYPRLFIKFPDYSFLNLDLTLGTFFNMTETDWLSWYDDELATIDSIEEIRKVTHEAGVNWDALEEIVFKMYNQNK